MTWEMKHYSRPHTCHMLRIKWRTSALVKGGGQSELKVLRVKSVSRGFPWFEPHAGLVIRYAGVALRVKEERRGICFRLGQNIEL